MKEIAPLVRRTLPLTALELLTLALAVITLPYLMRTLGPAGFGRYAVGIAASNLLAVFVDHGFNLVGTRAAARMPAGDASRAALFWDVQWAKAGLALASVPLLETAAWLLGMHGDYGTVLLAASASSASALLFPQWYLQGLQRFRTLASSLAAARTIAAVATLGLVTTSADAALAVALQASAGSLAAAFALRDGEYRHSIGRWKLNIASSRRILRESRPVFASSAAISVYTVSVPILLGAVATPVATGLFGVADRIRGALQALIVPLGTVALPQFSVWFAFDADKGRRVAIQMLKMHAVLGVAAFLTIGVLADPLIRHVLGDAYLPAVDCARVLGLTILLTGISNTLGVQMIIPLGMERAFSTISVAAAVAGIVMLAVLGRVWAEFGAAVAVVLVELGVAASMAVYLRRRLLS